MAYDIIEVELLFDELNTKTEKTVTNFKSELLSLRAGRANAHILDKVIVDYYGSQTPITEMSNITIPEARLLVISVWDVSAIKAVEKAIVAANLGITPSSDGKLIRMVFPELTQDRRKTLVKDVKTLSEKVKVAIRNERRDAMDILKRLKKDNIIAEDAQTTYEKDIEKITLSIMVTIDKLTAEKEIEIMRV